MIWLAACAGDDMALALADSRTGVAAALVSAELLAHVFDPPRALRHGGDTTCGSLCPCVQQEGLALPVSLTLDYAPEGCVPDSGLVPAPLAGHVTWVFDGAEVGHAVFDGLTLAGAPVGGDFGGAVAPTFVRPSGRISVGGASFDLDLDVTLDADVAFGGQIGAITFDDVSLPWDAIALPCPEPSAGVARWALDGARPSEVRFGDPGDGYVTVARGPWTSAPARWCDFGSSLW